jgi:hypothetical protein
MKRKVFEIIRKPYSVFYNDDDNLVYKSYQLLVRVRATNDCKYSYVFSGDEEDIKEVCWI